MGQLDSMGIHCNICTSFIHAAQEEGRDWARRQGQSLSVWDQAEPVDPERKRCAAHHCDKILVSDGVRQLYHLYSFIFIYIHLFDRYGQVELVPLCTTGRSPNIPTSANLHDSHKEVLMLWEATLKFKIRTISSYTITIPYHFITISPQLAAFGTRPALWPLAYMPKAGVV